MTMVLARPTRGTVPRAAWAALEVTFVSAAAHTAAGGGLPTAELMIALGVPVFAIGVLFMQHRLSLRTAFAGALLAQFGLHTAMVQLAATPGHAHHHDALSPGMVVAHTIGALAIVAAWAVRRRAWDVLTDWPTVWSTPAPRAHAVPTPRLISHSRVWLLTGPLRGPPRPFTCA